MNLLITGELLSVIPNEFLINHELPAKFLVSDVDAIEGSMSLFII